jgi:hypothetical protein
VPDHKVAWAAVEGATNAGAVTFSEVGPTQTEVHLSMEFEPEGFLETVADKLHIVENQAEYDLENFKRFIESEGYETGAWRGSIHEGATDRTPGVEDAASSYGDSGTVGDPAEREASFTGSRYVEDDVTGNPAVGEERVQDDSGLNATEAATPFGNQNLPSDPDIFRREDGRA